MKHSVSYLVMDPTKNITILVETPVPAASQPFVAAELMKLEPDAEQAGFLTKDPHRALRMAGGEFCGNASMSAAVFFASEAGLSEDTISLRVSGASEPVDVHVTAMEGGNWHGTVHMPRPLDAATAVFPDGITLPVVRFDGIAHIIIETDSDAGSVLTPEAAEQLAPVWCRHLETDALGLMFLERNFRDAGPEETHRFRMRPLVYVPAAGTLFWESSCASGTTAAGAYLRMKNVSAGRHAVKDVQSSISADSHESIPADDSGAGITCLLDQPGGTLEITCTPAGEYYLSGNVHILHRRTVTVDF